MAQVSDLELAAAETARARENTDLPDIPQQQLDALRASLKRDVEDSVERMLKRALEPLASRLQHPTASHARNDPSIDTDASSGVMVSTHDDLDSDSHHNDLHLSLIHI